MSTADAPSSDGQSQRCSFDDRDGRTEAMHTAIDEWIDQLATNAEEARTSEAFQRYLEVQAQFHDYSVNNTLLILAQMPDATKVAGFNTWLDLDRHVQEGESAIWIWAPLRAPECPECGNAPGYHDREHVDCQFHEESNPDTWSEGVVGFKPVPVFDISQTEGEPLPELEREATGDASALLPALRAVAEDRPLELEIVAPEEWSHGEAKGVCKGYAPRSANPVCAVKDRDNDADLARTIVHEIAHALLHYTERRDAPEREKKEVEAEAVAYVVCQHFGLDASGSSFYLASWSGEPAEALRERLDRIRTTAGDLIEDIEAALPEASTPAAPSEASTNSGGPTEVQA